MKKVTNVSLGGRSFILEEDAYSRLGKYLEHFRSRLTVSELQKGEVMEEIEGRIAELFYAEVGDGSRVITLNQVEKVTRELGMPDGSPEGPDPQPASGPSINKNKKLFRDMDNKAVAGVCSGLALYLDVDLTLVRLVMLLALLFGSAGFWIYIIFWIAVPKADTPAKKCDMYGIPSTAENLSRFAREQGGYKK